MVTTKEPLQDANSTKLKSFNARLREIFFPGIKLSPEDEVVMNIIYKILNASGTTKITPLQGPYYLINPTLHYYVRVGYGNVTVVNTVDSISRSLDQGTEEFMKKAIQQSVLRDVEIIEKTMFNNNLTILERIESKLPSSNGEDTHSA